MNDNKNNKAENKVDTQSRGWVFTVNNPKQNEQEFYDYLITLTSLQYFVFQRERGEQGTEHFQGYIEFNAPKRFSTMRNAFSEKAIGVQAHIEMRNGTKKDAHDYAKKIGKYTDKADTKIGQSYEWGEINLIEESGKRNDLLAIIQLLEEGAIPAEICENFPTQYFLYKQRITEYYRDIVKMQMRNTRRKLEVYYIYGQTGTGKTSYVLNKYGDENVYIMSDYPTGYSDKEKFDGYNGEDIILFDEFRSDIPLKRMLRYLDGYYCELPARYNFNIACYTKVYIVSNWSLNQQYPNIQQNYPDDWNAFCRRITEVYDFNSGSPERVIKEFAQLSMCENKDIIKNFS